ncbi:pyridoxal-phosphate dependent enzyme [Kutzneria sp. 744]|uniref:pyridoxal-phosphate dependent enzyme n=1 Tax=Kutzneria sp. (strain 744) TaxID=345341 RepID=UPI0003EEC7DC|nr:pyridoxal-phosphate dependent enzyme [Kutzneria sp. 744]EWM10352.1 pyridoxal-phosphate dependent enzyme [Kutzneria sp. 744]
MLFDNVREAIGHTPLVRLDLDSPHGVRTYAKLELQNLFGMKDRVAGKMILEARRTGTLRPGAPIVESSSGTMALGVALVGRSLGHEVHIVTDPRIDRITLAKLRALGCQVHVVERMHDTGGWQAVRIELLDRLLREMPDGFCPRQYSNPDNPGSYADLAAEILEDLGPIDILVGSVGSGGSLTGTARALRRTLPDLRVVGIDCVGSALFDQPDVPKRLQSGLGNSLHPQNLDRREIDEVHWLNDHEAFAATRDLALEQQIFAGNTAGSVYRVLKDVSARAAAGARVVGILPDRGDRYTGTVYSDEHWAEHSLSEVPQADRPAPVRYGTVVHTWSRADAGEIVHNEPHLLFVEANTSGTGVLALTGAEGLGYRPVLLTSRPERYAGLAGTGAEVLECDTNSLVALRAAVQKRFRREEIAGVTTTSDFYVPFVAELTSWLGLTGNTVDAVTTCRNKALLRDCLAAAGIPQPKYVAVTDAAQVYAAVEQVGLPCVVKPADDSGSTNVLLCRTFDEALAQTERVLAVHANVRGLPTAGIALVEEYVDGPEFSVELFDSFAGVTEKSVTEGPCFVEHRHLFPARSEELSDALISAARRAVGAAGIRSGATHTELRLTATGPVVIEINPRLAGGMIPALIELATGVDLVAQQLRQAVGLPVELTPSRSRAAAIQFLLAEREGTLVAVDGVDRARSVDGVDQVAITTRAGAEIRPARDAYDRLGYVIASHEDPEQTTKILAAAVAEIEVRTGG